MDTFIIACILTFIILSAEGVDRLFYRKKEKEEECTIFYDDHIDNSQYFKELEEIYNYVNSHNYDKFLSSALKNTIDKGYKLFETKKRRPLYYERFPKRSIK